MAMSPQQTNPAFMTGVPKLLILQLLAVREMYGYELVQAGIGTATGEVIRIGEGVPVYPHFACLGRSGLPESAPQTHTNGQTHIYCRVTAA